MGYFVYLLPSIVASMALVISLIYQRNKSGMIIAATTTMVLFLFIKDKVVVIPAINMLVLMFTLTYLIVTYVLAVRKNREEK